MVYQNMPLGAIYTSLRPERIRCELGRCSHWLCARSLKREELIRAACSCASSLVVLAAFAWPYQKLNWDLAAGDVWLYVIALASGPYNTSLTTSAHPRLINRLRCACWESTARNLCIARAHHTLALVLTPGRGRCERGVGLLSSLFPSVLAAIALAAIFHSMKGFSVSKNSGTSL